MILKASLVLATLLYPLAVFLGLQHWQASSLGLILAGLIALRLLLEPGVRKGIPGSRWLLSALLGFALLVYLINDQQLLRFYPVLMNSLLLLIFAHSLVEPPTVVERLARMQEPELDARGVRYTRIVTMVWCGFFLANGCVAAWTAMAASLAVWTLYNGLIAYLLMMAVFAVEYGVRRYYRARYAT